jgi:hypothetical protein
MTGFCKNGNEPAGSIKKTGYFFDKVSYYQLFK